MVSRFIMIYQTIDSECLGSPLGGIKGLIDDFHPTLFITNHPPSLAGLAQHWKYYKPQTPQFLIKL